VGGTGAGTLGACVVYARAAAEALFRWPGMFAVTAF